MREIDDVATRAPGPDSGPPVHPIDGGPEREPATPGRSLRRLWSRIEVVPLWLLLAWLVMLVVARSGLSWSGFEESLEFGRQFPRPGSSFRSNAVVGPALGWLTGADTPTRWVLLHSTLTAGWFVAVAVLLRRALGPGASWRVALVWTSFLSVPTSLLRHLGSYDVYTFWGAALVALGGTSGTAVVGGALMGATNVEQGALALLCWGLVSWALPTVDGGRRRWSEVVGAVGPAVLGLVGARLVVLAWFGQLDAAVQGRSHAFGQLLEDSVANAVSLGGVGAYSWLAVGWLVVLAVLWHLRDRPGRWVAALVGLVAVPAAATLTTLDGSRVFCAVSTAAVLVALVWLARRSELPDGAWMRTGGALLLVAGVLLPALNTTYLGELRVPWRFFVG